MKKLLLTLIALVGIMGCAPPQRTAEMGPQPVPRLTFSEDYCPSNYTALYIITDTKTNQEYMCVIRPEGAALCLIDQYKVKAEKE